MKLVKYYRDNCPGCEVLANYCELEDIKFDKVVHAVNDLTAEDRKALKLLSVPTVILFDDNDVEVGRMMGFDRMKLEILLVKRGE